MPQKNEVIYNRSVPYNTEAEIYYGKALELKPKNATARIWVIPRKNPFSTKTT
jgi:hypothetical protein